MTASANVRPGIGIWSSGLRHGDPAEIADAAAELEELGYVSLWIPDVGGDVFSALARLLDATAGVTVATGILNLWFHSAAETAAAHADLVAQYGDRTLLGIGVSHPALVDGDEPGRYARPLSVMREYLDRLDAEPVPLASGDRVLAALGPKMLELAAVRAAGVHPYNTTPEHTAIARAAVGPAGLVLPEQRVMVTTDADEAREAGRRFLSRYMELPNYVNNWRRLGFVDADFVAGGSDRFVDAFVAWGDPETIAARVHEHIDAGANQVCVQVIAGPKVLARAQWRALAPALLGR